MKKISLLLLLVVFSAATVLGEDTATQQQIDKLSGQIQDLLETQAQQGKRIDALVKDVADLRDKVNTPQVNNSASADDLKSLAEKVQEIDKKRQSDKELIVKQIDALGKSLGGTSTHTRTPATTPKNTEDTTSNTTTTPPVSDKGHYYTIQSGDSLGAIAKAYRDSGVKVTKAQIIAANPKMNPEVLIVGKKIFIPDADAK